MMISINPKDYQKKAFEDLTSFCKLLREQTEQPKIAWEQFWESKGLTPQSKYYHSRRTTEKDQQEIPNVCFHIPTGGGKTIMACEALRIIKHVYQRERTGLVLWLVPSDTIYKQTVNAFRDLQSPERGLLREAGLNRVRILEYRDKKRESFSRADVENYLCILPMTIQSFNAKNKRKIRQATGQFLDFFPSDYNVKDHEDYLKKTSNLEQCELMDIPTYASQHYQFVKPTLENVFRQCRPVVILDEAHRAGAQSTREISTLKKAMYYIRSYNPSFIMEITATPKAESNLLVQASGLDLLNEHMIKLPINVENISTYEWQKVVDLAVNKQKELERLARKQEGETGIYVRPIVLISAERTSQNTEQEKDPKYIHIEEVKRYLIQELKIPETHIKKQTAEEKELDGIDLMSRCDVRFILTRSALREGWNCPFAYILCSVDRATNSNTALTQLVGRVLRQPYAKAFKELALNESYVFALGKDVEKTYESIKEGLESEGFSGDFINAKTDDGKVLQEDKGQLKITRNPKFKEEQVFLPYLTYQHEDGSVVAFSWEQHLLPQIDYSKIKLTPSEVSLNHTKDTSTSYLINMNQDNKIENQQLRIPQPLEYSRLDVLYILSKFKKVIPNAWVAYQVVSPVLDSIQNARDSFGRCEEYREEAEKQIYLQCETLFKKMVKDNKIQFNLKADLIKEDLVWQPLDYFLPKGEELYKESGQPIEKALYLPVMKEFIGNKDEKKVAWSLDDANAVVWWHRIIEKKRNQYKIKGWERRNIYPDFLVKAQNNPNGESTYFLYETKGRQLENNEDTQYKESLLQLLQENYKVVGQFSTTKNLNAKIVMHSQHQKTLEADLANL